ncbi:hypothetical protein [uncultured Tessaracoccus sp.]|uniref:hypothetical protein n=1 Tax=uncultured Tessaracoccus sp. TaxID=905023 RepID=UPI002611ED95|nr:hypothetical protein [uncultured Tessaracoccus sp.]
MKTSIRVGVGSVVAAIVLSGVVGVTPASAACTAQGSKGDTSSLSWTRAMSNDCAGNVQARVKRYVQSFQTITDGPKSRNSYVSASEGSAGAGHALRIQIAAGGSTWTAWDYF